MDNTPNTDSIRKQASDKFNSLSYNERSNGAGLGYSLAQLTTIIQVREKNKSTWKIQDQKLCEWQKNIENHIKEEFLS